MQRANQIFNIYQQVSMFTNDIQLLFALIQACQNCPIDSKGFNGFLRDLRQCWPKHITLTVDGRQTVGRTDLSQALLKSESQPSENFPIDFIWCNGFLGNLRLNYKTILAYTQNFDGIWQANDWTYRLSPGTIKIRKPTKFWHNLIVVWEEPF